MSLQKGTSEPDYSLPEKQRPHPKRDKSVWRKEIPCCLPDKASISPYNAPTEHTPISKCCLTHFPPRNLASYYGNSGKNKKDILQTACTKG